MDITYEDFKKLLKFYYPKREACLEELNINFCLNLLRHTSLNKLIKDSNSKFKLLSRFDALNLSNISNNCLDLSNLCNLIQTCANLKSISFNLLSNLDHQYKIIFKSLDLTCLKQLESLAIEFKPSSSRTVLELIFNYCLNLNSLSLYSAYNDSNFILKLNKLNFLYEKLKYLKEFNILTDNIQIDIRDENFLEFFHKLEEFNLNININNCISNENYLRKLIRNSKVKFTQLNLGIDVNQLRASNVTLNTNPFELDEYLKDYLELGYEDKMEMIKISISAWPCFISNLNLILNSKYLTSLNISCVHIHSHQSTCQILSQFKCKNIKILIFIKTNLYLRIFLVLEEVSLPCCALANQEFKKIDQKQSFKRIFDDENQENTCESVNLKIVIISRFSV